MIGIKKRNAQQQKSINKKWAGLYESALPAMIPEIKKTAIPASGARRIEVIGFHSSAVSFQIKERDYAENAKALLQAWCKADVIIDASKLKNIPSDY